MHDIQHFAADLPARIPSVIASIKHLPLADKFGVDSLAQKSEGAIASTAQYLFATAPLWLARIFDLFTAFILCIYFMLEGEFVYFYFLSFFSADSRERLAKTLVVAEVRMSSWFVGQVALMLILGVCSTARLRPPARPLLLPPRRPHGPVQHHSRRRRQSSPSSSPPASPPPTPGPRWPASSSSTSSTPRSKTSFSPPRIMRSRVNLMGLSVLVALLAGTALAGVVGALVAIPTAALVAVLVDEYFIQKDAAEAAQAAAEAASAAYTESVAAAASADKPPPRPQPPPPPLPPPKPPKPLTKHPVSRSSALAVAFALSLAFLAVIPKESASTALPALARSSVSPP